MAYARIAVTDVIELGVTKIGGCVRANLDPALALNRRLPAVDAFPLGRRPSRR